MVLVTVDNSWIDDYRPCCDHCGRVGMRYGAMISPTWGCAKPVAIKLCRAYPKSHEKAGEDPDPNCFLLVTSGKEELGDRLDFDDDDDPPWIKHMMEDWDK
jgi:hypothetical protein